MIPVLVWQNFILRWKLQWNARWFVECVIHFQEVNGDAPSEEEAARLKEQMWPTKTSSVKAVFENKNQSDEKPKETPKQIDLEAEINGKQFDQASPFICRHKMNIIRMSRF